MLSKVLNRQYVPSSAVTTDGSCTEEQLSISTQRTGSGKGGDRLWDGVALPTTLNAERKSNSKISMTYRTTDMPELVQTGRRRHDAGVLISIVHCPRLQGKNTTARPFGCVVILSGALDCVVVIRDRLKLLCLTIRAGRLCSKLRGQNYAATLE